MFVLETISLNKNENLNNENQNVDPIIFSIQMGIQYSLKIINSSKNTDTTTFTKKNIDGIVPQQFSDFRFTTYSLEEFQNLRCIYGIEQIDYEKSFSEHPPRNLSNSGASGALFYITQNNKFILKTINKNEKELLISILPDYYEHFKRYPNTLLTKFVGLYTYASKLKTVSFVVMTNLFPPKLKIHQKYDLKGSTSSRDASLSERRKDLPTFKDNDFLKDYPMGFFLELNDYTKLIKAIENDTTFLNNYNIMDYSVLLGIHNLNQQEYTDFENFENEYLSDSKSNNQLPVNIIHASKENNDLVLLLIGIIDILQVYRIKKMLEVLSKGFLKDKNTISVQSPNFYAKRLNAMMIK